MINFISTINLFVIQKSPDLGALAESNRQARSQQNLSIALKNKILQNRPTLIQTVPAANACTDDSGSQNQSQSQFTPRRLNFETTNNDNNRTIP